MNFTEEARKLWDEKLDVRDLEEFDSEYCVQYLAAALQSAYERGEQSGLSESAARITRLEEALTKISKMPLTLRGEQAYKEYPRAVINIARAALKKDQP